jgi:hypothetical protein
MIAIAMLEATAAATPWHGRWAASGEIDYVRVWASEHSVAGR